MSRFDIAEAWFLYLYSHNCGQSCKNYQRLCKMMEWFSPRHSLSDFDDLTDESKIIYKQIVERTMN